MNTEQTIKDLESCISKHHENCCQLGSWHEEWNCMTHLMKRSLALIKEFQAHNENLQNDNNYLRGRLAEEAALEKDMAIVRVNRSSGKSQRLKTVVHIRKAAIVSATIKEMRHKLITRVRSYRQMDQPPSFGLFYQIITETTEELLKAPEKENKSEKGTPHE